MKYIPTFKQFINERYDLLNEANLSQELLKFKPGDTVVITKSITPKDFDFRKSARTWWGEKVASEFNIITRGDEYNRDRTFTPGDVLWIFTKPSTIDSKGRAKITGVAGGFQGSLSDDPGKYSNTAFEVTYNYDRIETQIIILALQEGYAEVINYNKLPKSKRDELEASIKMDRVRDIIRNNSVIYGDMEVTAYLWQGGRGHYILKGYNKDTGEKMPDKLVKSGTIASETFIDSKTKKEISGNPLK
jgi:hypothetical protein